MDLFRALCFLHQSNPPLLHRDIKPANLLLSGDWKTMKVRAKPEFLNPKSAALGRLEDDEGEGRTRIPQP
jgi:serine/threonine protein kinase